MEAAAQSGQDDAQRYHLQRLASELDRHGWHCALEGNHLKVANPHESGLSDNVVCQRREDGWHYALVHHKAQSLGPVVQIVDVARRIMSILAQIRAEPGHSP
jgi:hypothetical protein